MTQIGRSNDRAAFLTGIIFPDLMKYSMLRSVPENLAASALAAFTGQHNLSIGFFQITQNCACDIECYLTRHPEHAVQYRRICYDGKIDRLNVILRNHRLLDPETAVYYADAFLDMYYEIYGKDHDCGSIDMAFRDEAFFRMTSVAYSSGHHLSKEDLLYRMDIANYPYGWNDSRSLWNYQSLAFAYWKSI